VNSKLAHILMLQYLNPLIVCQESLGKMLGKGCLRAPCVSAEEGVSTLSVVIFLRKLSPSETRSGEDSTAGVADSVGRVKSSPGGEGLAV
jgi:hypothetical protein